MVRNLISVKAAILAFELAFVLCFFSGIFYVFSSGFYSKHDLPHWYYVNRGLFISWAGVSLRDTAVELPLIKAPFILIKEDWVGGEWNKVIDLGRFLPIFASIFILAYLVAYPLIRASDKNKSINISYLFIIHATLSKLQLFPCIA